MKDILLTAISFVAVFGTIVLFHELGHFTVAKAFGVRVHEFAVGIGPAIWRKRRGETQYSLRVLPLGGFVKLAGMDEALRSEDELPEDDVRNFDRRPVWQRMLVIVAGPMMNFFLAFLLIAGYYMVAYIPPSVAGLMMGSPAERAGLVQGDIIIDVDGHRVDTATEVIEQIQPRGGEEIVLTVKRGNELLQLPVTPRYDSDAGVGMIGIEISGGKPRYGFPVAVSQAVKDVWRGTIGIIGALTEMITGKSEVDLRGPIGIITITGEAARRGFDAVLSLAIGLNLNLGLLNLLPIPVLDGGWLVLLAWEGVRGRPLPPEQRGVAQFIGLVIILALMVFAVYQDVLHLST